MAALSTAAEYTAIREAIQRLSTLDSSGNPQNVVSINIEGFSLTYSAAQMPELQKREIELAKRLSVRNLRKRVTPDFSDAGSTW
jgi:hypothetical protein